MADEQTRAELNRLYWETDASVSDISERLGLSRRALYDELVPLPSAVSCPECGGELGYRNRTTASANEAECAACGFETEVGADGGAVGAEPAVEQEARGSRLSPARPVPATGGGAALGAALVVGMGAGAVAGWLLRRV